MTTMTTRSYESLRGRHPAEVYELVHQVELELMGSHVPETGPQRDAFMAEVRRRQREASRAHRAGTDALIALLEDWDSRYGR